LCEGNAVYAVSGNVADRVYIQEFVDDYEFTYFLPAKAVYHKISEASWSNLSELIFDLFKPDLIHVHHIMNSTFDFIQNAKKNEIPVVFSIHDYYSICPNYTLLNEHSSLLAQFLLSILTSFEQGHPKV